MNVLLAFVLLCGTRLVFGQVDVVWTQILPTSAVQLRTPQSISVTSDGILYIADTGHHRVIAVDSIANVVHETGGFGSEHGQFQWPRKVIADRGASVWVLDHGNRRIEKFSRTLEYQGTFTIPSDDNEVPSQIEEFALSPQGDLFVFDRDGGRLVRYDPLFRAQGELGQRSGADFVSTVTQMEYASRIGIVWWERGSGHLKAADPLFGSVTSLKIDGNPKDLILASVDSCVAFGSVDGLNRWCEPQMTAEVVMPSEALATTGLKRLDDFAVTADKTYYLLDGLGAAVYRVSLPQR